jgi:hypothetical protein
MSLNELILAQPKKWLNIEANNVVIDGVLSVTEGVRDSVLNYTADGSVKFSPLKVFNEVECDYYNIVPVTGAVSGVLDLAASGFPIYNFTLSGGNTLTCTADGVYLIITKLVQSGGAYTSRPNPFIGINSVADSSSSIRIPLSRTAIANYSGYQTASMQSLIIGDELVINLATQPVGTINMQNDATASNILLIKIA